MRLLTCATLALACMFTSSLVPADTSGRCYYGQPKGSLPSTEGRSYYGQKKAPHQAFQVGASTMSQHQSQRNNRVRNPDGQVKLAPGMSNKLPANAQRQPGFIFINQPGIPNNVVFVDVKSGKLVPVRRPTGFVHNNRPGSPEGLKLMHARGGRLEPARNSPGFVFINQPGFDQKPIVLVKNGKVFVPVRRPSNFAVLSTPRFSNPPAEVRQVYKARVFDPRSNRFVVVFFRR